MQTSGKWNKKRILLKEGGGHALGRSTDPFSSVHGIYISMAQKSREPLLGHTGQAKKNKRNYLTAFQGELEDQRREVFFMKTKMSIFIVCEAPVWSIREAVGLHRRMIVGSGQKTNIHFCVCVCVCVVSPRASQCVCVC